MGGESGFRHWDELIPDALGLIFKTLSLQEVLQVIPMVCKSWGKVVEGPYCWKNVDIDEWSMRNQSRPAKIDRMLRTLITRSAGSLLELRVSNVDDQMLSFVADHVGSLQILILKWSSISDSTVAQVATNFSSLTTLDLSHCNEISTRAFEAIGRSCKTLASLTWYKNPPEVTELKRILSDPTVSEEALAIARTMPKLKRLGLAYITINDSVVLDILSGCPELELLDIRFCRGVDTLDVELLGQKYPRVKVLDPGSIDFDSFFSDKDSESDDNSGEEYYGEYYEDDDYDGGNYGYCN